MTTPVFEAFALRHTLTGRFMPYREGRGHSHWEPHNEPEASIPRLLRTKRGAINTRTAWSVGPWERRIVHTSGTPDNPPETYDETVPVAPSTPRSRDDLEIVKVCVVPEDLFNALVDVAKAAAEMGHFGGVSPSTVEDLANFALYRMEPKA